MNEVDFHEVGEPGYVKGAGAGGEDATVFDKVADLAGKSYPADDALAHWNLADLIGCGQRGASPWPCA